MADFPTFNDSWPWPLPWPWIGSYCTPSCITHTCIPNFIEIEETFLWTDGRTDGRTNVRTGGRTFETNFIRTTLRSRPSKLYARGRAQRAVCPAKRRLENSGVIDQSLPNFYQTSRGHRRLRSFHRCGMPAHRMMVRYANFRRFAPKKIGYQITYHNNVRWTIAVRRSDWSFTPIFMPVFKIKRRSIQYIMRLVSKWTVKTNPSERQREAGRAE